MPTSIAPDPADSSNLPNLPNSTTTAGFASELLALLAAFGRCCPLPSVKALHLPPASAAGTKDGEFCALELDDGSFGLSYVMLEDTLAVLSDLTEPVGNAGAFGQADPPVKRHRIDLTGMPALVLAQWLVSAQGACRVLGFAAANALSQCLFKRACFVFDHDRDSLGGLAPGLADHIGMIGHFTPLIPRIVGSGARLTVAELNPEFAGERDDYRVTLDPSELGACNKILSTSTVLLNDTLDGVLAQCRLATWFAMVGPNAGCLPDPLFARGVSAVGGVEVINRDAFVAALTEGRRWGSFVRKYTIARAGYPGCQVLLDRCCAGKGENLT